MNSNTRVDNKAKRYLFVLTVFAVLLMAYNINLNGRQNTPPYPPTVQPTNTPTIEERLVNIESLLSEQESTTASVKDIVGIANTFVTTIGVVLGGIWTYWLFVKNRQRYPRASVSHEIVHAPINSQKTWMRLSVTIKNTGTVLLSLTNYRVFVQQILPPPNVVGDAIGEDRSTVGNGGTEFGWWGLGNYEDQYELGSTEVEPGEEQEFQYDFLIDAEVKIASIYTHYKNISKPEKEIGWDKTTIYKIS